VKPWTKNFDGSWYNKIEGFFIEKNPVNKSEHFDIMSHELLEFSERNFTKCRRKFDLLNTPR
jgi:hypothetical protein